MCKYCESDKKGERERLLDSRKLGRYCDSYVGIDIAIENNALYIQACTESPDGGSGYIENEVNISHCPNCGTPLGEVKPLTVEQVREMDGKPVWCKEFKTWALVYIHENREPHLILADGSPLINHPANRYTLYDREPKGETE